MKKLAMLGLMFSSYGYASIELEKPVYEYECVYSTSWEQEEELEKDVVVVVRGEVDSLSELKGKQKVIVDSDGQKVTLEVGNCKVEL